MTLSVKWNVKLSSLIPDRKLLIPALIMSTFSFLNPAFCGFTLTVVVCRQIGEWKLHTWRFRRRS